MATQIKKRNSYAKIEKLQSFSDFWVAKCQKIWYKRLLRWSFRCTPKGPCLTQTPITFEPQKVGSSNNSSLESRNTAINHIKREWSQSKIAKKVGTPYVLECWFFNIGLCPIQFTSFGPP